MKMFLYSLIAFDILLGLVNLPFAVQGRPLNFAAALFCFVGAVFIYFQAKSVS